MNEWILATKQLTAGNWPNSTHWTYTCSYYLSKELLRKDTFKCLIPKVSGSPDTLCKSIWIVSHISSELLCVMSHAKGTGNEGILTGTTHFIDGNLKCSSSFYTVGAWLSVWAEFWRRLVKIPDVINIWCQSFVNPIADKRRWHKGRHQLLAHSQALEAQII